MKKPNALHLAKLLCYNIFTVGLAFRSSIRLTHRLRGPNVGRCHLVKNCDLSLEPGNQSNHITTRRIFASKFIATTSAVILSSLFENCLGSSDGEHQFLRPANAANLPKSTGADLYKTGTTETLIPIIRMRLALQSASSILHGKDQNKQQLFKSIYSIILHDIPREEQVFKRAFDAYSTPVTYKQIFLDQNAFLVYYTRGFDGPNRPNIESSDFLSNLHTQQYSCRNDAWNAIDDLLTEIEFADGDLEDVSRPLERALSAFDEYLSLAPKSQVEEAMLKVC